MCTVSFIPVNGRYYITSNRDEKAVRKTAFPPAVYWNNGQGLLYPKDADAGGTWICLQQNGHAAVLLNGAFTKHIPQPPYRRSRGLVFLEIISNERPVLCFSKIELEKIEPFTLIIFENNCLYECRWDGQQKHCLQLKSHRPYIWSSATLYDAATIAKREQWFLQWLNKNPQPSAEAILQFHRFTGEGDTNNDLVMNRGGQLFTVSITAIELQGASGKMNYLDLKNNSSTAQQFSFAALPQVA